MTHNQGVLENARDFSGKLSRLKGPTLSSYTDFVINLHHCPDVVRAHFGDGTQWGVRIIYSHESVLRGTAGALKPWREFFDASFLVVYGDNLLTGDLSRLLESHRDAEADVTVALFTFEV